MSILEVSNIRKSFGKLEVLKGIDLHIGKGEVVSIVISGEHTEAVEILKKEYKTVFQARYDALAEEVILPPFCAVLTQKYCQFYVI